MQLLIKHKIWIGFALILSLLLIIAGLSIVKFNGTKKTVNAVVVDSQPMLILAQSVSAHLGNAHSAVGNFLITGSDKNRQAFQNEMYEANESINAMAELGIVKKTPMFLQHIESFRNDMMQYQSYETKVFSLSKDLTKNKPAVAFASSNLNPLATEILSLIYQMIESEADEEASEERVSWLNHMHSVRYNMVKLMSTTRVYMNSPDNFALQNMQGEIEVIVPVSEKMNIEEFVELYTFEQEEGVPQAIKMIKEYSVGTNKLTWLHTYLLFHRLT